MSSSQTQIINADTDDLEGITQLKLGKQLKSKHEFAF